MRTGLKYMLSFWMCTGTGVGLSFVLSWVANNFGANALGYCAFAIFVGVPSIAILCGGIAYEREQRKRIVQRK